MEIYAYFGASLAIWQLSVVLCCRNHVSTLATIVAAFGDNVDRALEKLIMV